jgi:hypothetical protein
MEQEGQNEHTWDIEVPFEIKSSCLVLAIVNRCRTNKLIRVLLVSLILRAAKSFSRIMLLRHEQVCLEGMDVQILCLLSLSEQSGLALAALANLLHLQEAQILASCGTMDWQQLSCKLLDQHHGATNQKRPCPSCSCFSAGA